MSAATTSVGTLSVGAPFKPNGLKLMKDNPGDIVDFDNLIKDKKVVIFGVPGAFTPGCNKTHLPGYIQNYDKIKEKGVDLIICLSVNDPFVMQAWGKDSGVGDKILMLSDPAGEFVKATGLDFFAAALGGVRSRRFSAILENGIVKAINVEPDNAGLSCTLVNPLLNQL